MPFTITDEDGDLAGRVINFSTFTTETDDFIDNDVFEESEIITYYYGPENNDMLKLLAPRPKGYVTTGLLYNYTLNNSYDESSQFILFNRYKMAFIYYVPMLRPKLAGATYRQIITKPINTGVIITVSFANDLSTNIIDSAINFTKPVIITVRNTGSRGTFTSSSEYIQKERPFGIEFKGTLSTATQFLLPRQQSINNAKTVGLLSNVSKKGADISVFLSQVDVRVVRCPKNLGVYIPKYNINTIEKMVPFTVYEITLNTDTAADANVNIPSLSNARPSRLRTLKDNYPIDKHLDYISYMPFSFSKGSRTVDVFAGTPNREFSPVFSALEQLYQSYIVFPENIFTNIPRAIKCIGIQLLAVTSTGKIDVNNNKVPVIYGFGWCDNIVNGSNKAFVAQFYNVTPSTGVNPVGYVLPKIAFIRVVFSIDRTGKDIYNKRNINRDDFDVESGQHQVYPLNQLVNTNYPMVKNNPESHNGKPFKMVGDGSGVGSFATGFSGSANFNTDGTIKAETNQGQYAYVMSECDWRLS